jgi:hypothetical protein
MKNHTSRTSTQSIVGAGIIALGILFLLDNFGIMDARYVLGTWPSSRSARAGRSTRRFAWATARTLRCAAQ